MTTSDPELTPVNDLADRFWEAVLELDPTTATMYGDERYSDRLGDPGPEGRAKARELMERTAAEAAAIDSVGLPTEDRITRDMLKVIADLNIEEDDQRLHQLRVVDQMGGPQQLLPQLTQFQPADTPERLDAFVARLDAYPAFMAANAQILRDGMASGLTAPRIVAERTIAQIERMLDVPIDAAIVPAMVNVATEADREHVRDIVRDVVYPADLAFLDVLRGDYRSATREEPGLWSAPDGDRLYRTAIRSWTTLDLDPEEVHRIGLDELESIEDERRVIARDAGFGDDTAAYRASLDADPANTPRSKDELVERATGDIERAMAIAPRYFGVLPRAACDVRHGRGVQGEGRAVRLLLPARDRRLAAGDLLRQRLRPAEPQVHQARDDDVSRGGARSSLPDHPRDGEPAPQHLPPPRRPDGRGCLRRGLGPVQRAPRRRDGAVPRRARAVRDARRAGVAGGPAGRGHRTPRASLATRPVDRSSSRTPGCRPPMRRSRPTAISAGRARP